MRIVLWDTRKLGISKDFAGGMGVGRYRGGSGPRDRFIRYFYSRDRRPVALLYAHLAAVFRQLGHEVQYVEDRIPADADLYVFNPSLITLELERQAITAVREKNPRAAVLVVGLVASVMPEVFSAPGVTVVKGEAEQLLWKLDEVLARPGTVANLGVIEDLDSIPFPDWSLFSPQKFRIGYDFWKFPTALVQQSRGCSFKCNYCPYILLDGGTRFRSPEAVVEEIDRDARKWGFRSFKFRDPLFGLDRGRLFRLAELLGRLPRPIQFSIETRIDLVRPEILRVLKRVGLTSITVGIETPDEESLRRYSRTNIKSDRQREFIDTCREMGIRTVAGFMIGFPHDTEKSIRAVLDYATLLGPTFANFNIVTPYPGTQFFAEIKDCIADFDFSRYDVYTPVLKYENLSRERVAELHGKCFRHYYFRWPYLAANAHLLWPFLQRFGFGRSQKSPAGGDEAHAMPPKPKALGGVDLLLEKKGFRKDGPHGRHPTAKNRAEQDQADS